jgi:hypothetical protein
VSTAASQIGTLVVGAGFASAVALGWIVASADFCTMAALSDIVNMGHWGRMRMWLLAIAVAVAGNTMLGAAAVVVLAPLAFGLELLVLWTDASLHLTFGIASVLGVVALPASSPSK